MQQKSITILVGMAAIFSFQVFSTNVTQAYLQSTKMLKRNEYTKPPPELGLALNQLLKLMKQLYGLADMRDSWGRSMRKDVVSTFGMHNTLTNSALYFKAVWFKLIGLYVTYVDDFLHARSPQYFSLRMKTEERFQ